MRVCCRAVLAAVAVVALACDHPIEPSSKQPPGTGGTTGAEPPLHELAGLVPFNDQPWDSLTGNGWSYTRRAASKNSAIVTDGTAPHSPPNVLGIVFTTDMRRNTDPGAHWIGLPGVKETYTGWWIKVSRNWKCSPAGCGKMTFLFTKSSGAVYTNLYHRSDAVQGPPFRIGSNTEWEPYGQQHRLPNVMTTLVYPDQWHRIEFYYKYETSPGAGDGIIRWWVDGVLNGDYRNIRYPTAPFAEFVYAPTLQNPPPVEQYMYIDHTDIKIR